MEPATNKKTIETPSGKGAGDENFPVGSRLIRAALRPHIHAYYDFARMGDDIADNALLSPQEKVVRLERIAAIIRGDTNEPDIGAARRMRNSLIETGIDPVHCLDLLTAFKRDATKLRYADWAELLDYCRYSAAAVGRYVLALHGESESCWPASDALCAALQIVNHLQDCAEDYAILDRVYLPLTDVAACGSDVSELSGAKSSPALRKCITLLTERMQPMLAKSRALTFQVKDRRLALEIAAIQALAEKLCVMLLREDPLAGKVKLRKGQALFTAGSAILCRLLSRRKASGNG